MKRPTPSIVRVVKAQIHHYRSRDFDPISRRPYSSTKTPHTSRRTMAALPTTTSTVSSSTAPKPPAIRHVLETCLMMKDVPAATEFYKNIFSIEPFLVSVSTPLLMILFSALSPLTTMIELLHNTHTWHSLECPASHCPRQHCCSSNSATLYPTNKWKVIGV